jgi:hypothetical protein
MSVSFTSGSAHVIGGSLNTEYIKKIYGATSNTTATVLIIIFIFEMILEINHEQKSLILENISLILANIITLPQ